MLQSDMSHDSIFVRKNKGNQILRNVMKGLVTILKWWEASNFYVLFSYQKFQFSPNNYVFPFVIRKKVHGVI